MSVRVRRLAWGEGRGRVGVLSGVANVLSCQASYAVKYEDYAVGGGEELGERTRAKTRVARCVDQVQRSSKGAVCRGLQAHVHQHAILSRSPRRASSEQSLRNGRASSPAHATTQELTQGPSSSTFSPFSLCTPSTALHLALTIPSFSFIDV